LASRTASGGLLIAAGLYQLSPIKDACLSRCRSPAEFISRHYRAGIGGAARLGLLHGAFCVGCCWLLMALLFVGGVMNLLWVAGLTLLVAVEKLLPGGKWIARIAGLAMIGWGVALLLG
jgi:predicted metal-binding membrane protein